MNAQMGQYIGPMQNYATTIRGRANQILTLPHAPTGSRVNALTTDFHPSAWHDNSKDETRILEFIPLIPAATDVPFLQGAPEAMISRVLEKSKRELKTSSVPSAVLEQNLKSLLDCTDPSTLHGFDAGPYPKNVTLEDLIKYIETMYSKTKNKKRFENTDRLHIFNVDASMNVLDSDKYETIWLNHADPTGQSAQARSDLLAASTETEIVSAIINCVTTSILCSLRMHLIHFAAALKPSEFSKIQAMLADKNSLGYQNFKGVLQDTMSEVFDVNSSPLEHFENKILGFNLSEAWFSSMLSLIYGAQPLSLSNPRGLKRNSCSVRVLENSYTYFNEEEPVMTAIADYMSQRMIDEELHLTKSLDDEAIAEIKEEVWKSVSTKGFRFEDEHLSSHIYIESGKLTSHSSADDGGFNFTWDNDGKPALKFWDTDMKFTRTYRLFDDSGDLNIDATAGLRGILFSSLSYKRANLVLDDIISYEKGVCQDRAVFRSRHNNKARLILRPQHHIIKAFPPAKSSPLSGATFGNLPSGSGIRASSSADAMQNKVDVV
tara:strand:- start:191 stop:1834 length:1644 start_codon:yes stop_codon:yes gene_type:complete